MLYRIFFDFKNTEDFEELKDHLYYNDYVHYSNWVTDECLEIDEDIYYEILTILKDRNLVFRIKKFS